MKTSAPSSPSKWRRLLWNHFVLISPQLLQHTAYREQLQCVAIFGNVDWRRRRRKSNVDGRQRELERWKPKYALRNNRGASLAHITAHWWRPNKEKRYHLNYIVSTRGKSLFFCRARVSQIEQSRGTNLHFTTTPASSLLCVCVLFKFQRWTMKSQCLSVALRYALPGTRLWRCHLMVSTFDVCAHANVWDPWKIKWYLVINYSKGRNCFCKA